MFTPSSRYANVPDRTLTDETGREIRYKGQRFIQETPGSLAHAVTQGERLDRIAHRYYGDAERFWRICDANGAMWPPDLSETPGRLLIIPPAQG